MMRRKNCQAKKKLWKLNERGIWGVIRGVVRSRSVRRRKNWNSEFEKCLSLSFSCVNGYMYSDDAFVNIISFTIPTTEAKALKQKHITTTKRRTTRKKLARLLSLAFPFFPTKKSIFIIIMPSAFFSFYIFAFFFILFLCHILFPFESFSLPHNFFLLRLLLSVTFNFIFNYNFSLDVSLSRDSLLFFSLYSSLENMQHRTLKGKKRKNVS